MNNPHPPIPTVVEAYENAFPAPQRIAARTSTGLKNMAAFFVSRAERTNEVYLCAYEVADTLKEAADAIKQLERERDEARATIKTLQDIKSRHEVDELRAAQENDRLERERDEAREAVKLAASHLSDQTFELRQQLGKTRQERDEAREALRVLWEDYKQLADSGDAGFWNLEDKDAAQPALRILKALEAGVGWDRAQSKAEKALEAAK